MTPGRLAFGVALVAVLAGRVSSAPSPKPPEPPRAFTGKVLTLGTILTGHGVKLDADAAGAVALVADDGTTYPLAKDDGSRLLFLDKQLHDRPVKLTARVIPGTQILKVEKIQTVVKGQVFDLDFWWDTDTPLNPDGGRDPGVDTAFREFPAKAP